MRDEIKEWRQIIELQNNLKGMNTINDGGIKKMMETAGTISGIQELAGLVMSALEFSVLSGGEIPIFNNKKIDELIALFLKHCFLSTAKRETDWNIDIAVMEEIVEKSGEIPCSPADVTPSLYKELEYSINFVQYRKSVRNYEPKDGLRAILICLYILSTNIEDKRSDPETLESVLKYLKSEDKWKLAMQYVGVISFGVHEAHAIIDISEISKILKTSSVFPAAYMKGMINRKSKEPTFSLGAKYLVAQVVVSFSSLVLIPFRENLEQHTKCIGSEEKSKEYQELKDLLSDICVHSADRNRYLDEFKWIILTKMTLLSNQRKLDLISRSPSEEMKSHVDVLIARITDLESNWKKMIQEMKKVKKDNSDMRRILEPKPAAEDDSKKRKHSMQKDMQGGSLSGSPATKRKKFQCNTNVLQGLSGKTVFYVTNYASKNQQTEETEAFKMVSQRIIKTIENQQNQENEDEIPSDYRTGFRRLLAGVYTHTHAHVIAAPMAHYLSLKGSRFTYSHQQSYLPIHGLDKILKQEQMVMNFKNVGGSNKAYHKAMDYIERPTGFEDFDPYRYFSETKSVSKSYAKAENLEFWDFKETHPLHGEKVVVYYDNERIPVLPWSFLPSTTIFESTLLEPVGPNDPLYTSREEYCYRFMLLFMPYRTFEDFTLEGSNSFQEKFSLTCKLRGFSDNAKKYGDNIQSINNSLNSQTPTNILGATTEDIEEDLDAADMINENEEDFDSSLQLDGLLESYFASSCETIHLTEEAKELDPQIKDGQGYQYIPQMTEVEGIGELRNVIHQTDQMEIDTASNSTQKQKGRYKISIAELNTLFLSRSIRTSQNEINDDMSENQIVAKGDCNSIINWGIMSGLDTEQQIAFEIMVAAYVLTFVEEAVGEDMEAVSIQKKNLKRLARYDKRKYPDGSTPVVLFVTGPAGAGKSKILETVEKYCNAFSKKIGHNYHQSSIRFSAITGTAAVSIGGDTTSKQFSLNRKKDGATIEDLENFNDTRLCIVDEISFSQHSELTKLSKNLGWFTQSRTEIYGKIPMVFLGDFHQLKPCRGDAIFSKLPSPEWELGITDLVELKQQHRFSKCTTMQRMMRNMYEEVDEKELRDLINSRVVDGDKVKLPKDRPLQFACFTNKKRANLNSMVFRDHLKKYHQSATENDIPQSAIVIKTKPTWKRRKKAFSFGQRQMFFEHCSESDVRDPNKNRNNSAPPLLTLFSGCEMMVTQNKDVSNGIASGTRATFDHVKLKDGIQPHPLRLHGYWVKAVNIEDVDYIVLKWKEDSIRQGTFKLFPTQLSFNVDFPFPVDGKVTREKIPILLEHFPAVLNFATTVHKLQGQSLDSLVITEWAPNNFGGWPYVALSRVKTIDGLYLLCPLPDNLNIRTDPLCNAMLQRMRNTYNTSPLDIVDLHNNRNL